MRHHNVHKQLGRVRKVRIGLVRSLMISLIEREKITTTQVRAKTLSSSMEKLVTRARMNNDIATKRIITARLGNHRSAAKKLIEDIAPRYEKRLGGYTRVVKLPRRQGDAAQMAIIEFV